MSTSEIIAPAGLIFVCLWNALLARFKGYRAACWLFAGGLIGVLAPSYPPLAGSRHVRFRPAPK